MENFDFFLHADNQLYSNFFLEISRRYCKFFSVFQSCLAKPMKNVVSTAEKFDNYHHVKNQLYYSLLSWDITTKLGTYIEYYKHASLLPSNMIVPTWSKIWCLFLRKSTSSLTFFWRYCKGFCKLAILATMT